MGNSTPKIVTSKPFSLKLNTRDYVGETTHHVNFGFNQSHAQVELLNRFHTLWLK